MKTGSAVNNDRDVIQWASQNNISLVIVLKNINGCILYNILTLSVVFDALASITFADEYYVLVDFNNKYGIYDPNRNYISGCKWEFITDYDGKYIYFELNNTKIN